MTRRAMWQVDLSSTYHCETCISWCDFGVPMWLLIGLLCSYLDFVWCCDSYVRSWNLCDIQVVKFFCGACVGWLRFTCFTLEFSFADLVYLCLHVVFCRLCSNFCWFLYGHFVSCVWFFWSVCVGWSWFLCSFI